MQTIKKVIFFIPTLAGGGAERVVSELSCNMPDSIEQYIVLFEDKVGYPHKARVLSLGLDSRTCKNLFLKFGHIVKRFTRFKKAVDDIKPDAVVSFLQANTINALVGLRYSGRRYKLILSERTATSKITLIMKGLYGWVNRAYIRFLYNKADSIIAVSECIKKDLVEKFSVDPIKIRVIYNPVDIEKVNALAKEDVEHPWFKEKVPILVNVGRLAEQKNQKELLEALAEIRKSAECRLAVIGEGELREGLLRLARSLHLEKDVLFLGFQENPFKYIARSTAFVLPSLFEGFPNALVEAMALGCPVIASDCPSGPNEILCPGLSGCGQVKGLVEADYGLLYEVGDVKALVAGAKKLLNDEITRRRYGELAKKRSMDFEKDKIISEYMSVLNNETAPFKENHHGF